jgi:hypothetical protein
VRLLPRFILRSVIRSCRKNENWESKLSFQAEEFLKEREHRDSEVKSWEKEKKRWKAFKTELETEVCNSLRACNARRPCPVDS